MEFVVPFIAVSPVGIIFHTSEISKAMIHSKTV